MEEAEGIERNRGNRKKRRKRKGGRRKREVNLFKNKYFNKISNT